MVHFKVIFFFWVHVVIRVPGEYMVQMRSGTLVPCSTIWSSKQNSCHLHQVRCAYLQESISTGTEPVD